MMTEKTHTVTTYFVPARTDGLAEGWLAERATMAMGSVSRHQMQRDDHGSHCVVGNSGCVAV